jgi:hypothetical protein
MGERSTPHLWVHEHTVLLRSMNTNMCCSAVTDGQQGSRLQAQGDAHCNPD